MAKDSFKSLRQASQPNQDAKCCDQRMLFLHYDYDYDQHLGTQKKDTFSYASGFLKNRPGVAGCAFPKVMRSMLNRLA